MWDWPCTGEGASIHLSRAAGGGWLQGSCGVFQAGSYTGLPVHAALWLPKVRIPPHPVLLPIGLGLNVWLSYRQTRQTEQ